MTVSDVEELSPERRALLELLRREREQQRGEASDSARPPAGRTRSFELVSEEDRELLPQGLEDSYPLTAVQLGMLYHMELTADEDTPAYMNVNSFHLEIPFDAEKLQRAVDLVVERHPLLRTSFALHGYAEPLQLVHRQARLPIHFGDVRNLSAEEQRGFFRDLLDRLHHEPFDLSEPPLLRLRVYRRTDATVQLVLVEPHAISDGWSTTSTLSEAFSIYLALVRGEPIPEVPPSNVTFRDFVALEREAIEDPDHRRFWHRHIDGAAPLELPRWRSEWLRRLPPEKRKAQTPVEPEVLEGLKRLGREEGVPLKSVLLAAHVKVMSIVSGQREVLTGLTAHGRPEDLGGEQVRGMFLNSLPLNLPVHGGTWRSLVRRCFEAEIETIPHQRYPISALQRRLQGRPLFDTFFSYLRFHSAQGILQDPEFRVVHRDIPEISVTHYKLVSGFQVPPTGFIRLRFNLEFDDRFLAPEQIALFHGYFARVLRAMATDPDGLHDARSWLSKAEKHRMLVEWNAPRWESSWPGSVPSVVSERARREPHRSALRSEAGTLSYGELERRSNRLANHLLALGVGPEVAVGVCVERSVELVVAALGTLKAGGVYLPLDAEYPKARLRHLLGNSSVAVVVADEVGAGALPDEPGVRVLRLDREHEAIQARPSEAPPASSSEAQAAYRIYTSGSTGRPKGVTVSHGALGRHLAWMQEHVPLGSGDRVLQKTSVGFDPSLWELFGPLQVGAELVLARPGGQRDGVYLARAVREHRITVLRLVPSQLRLLLEAPELSGCSSLRRVLSGGEVLAPELVERLWRELDVEVNNLYGPTEATVVSAAGRARGWREPERSVPIGRPAGGSALYLLDAAMQPVAVGARGELWIGGHCLARGYHGQPARTAERFLPDPFSGESGARMYRTGDAARWHVDGELEFLDRLDRQAKVRGHRIEPGEVESVLAEHPAVRSCAVVARPDASGGSRLVAYTAGASREEPGADALRRHLRTRLPDFMVPSAFVALETLPRTASGKVDRGALPEPARGAAESYRPPETLCQQILAGLWGEVLDRRQVGIDDDFFALGGHSLSAAQLASRVRKAFGVELPLRKLFELPTVGALSGWVEGALAKGAQPDLPAIRPLERRRDQTFPLSFAQERLWFMQHLIPGTTAYNVVSSVRMRGRLDLGALHGSVASVVERHDVLRSVFPEVAGRPVQIVQPPRPFLLPLVDLTALPVERRDAEAKAIAQAEARRVFDLEVGPLLQAAVVRVEASDHLVSFVLHHLVSDAWSRDILIREVTAAYRSLLRGKKPDLRELPVQYADFAHWQRNVAADLLQPQLDYWRRHLGGAPEELSLPTDRPRPETLSFRGAILSFELPAETSGALVELSRRTGVTLFMTLLTGFVLLLHRWTGREDVVVGTDVANRHRLELEGLIGFFVNNLALRTDLRGDPTVREVLARVRDVTLGALANQDVPFDMLVRELGVRRRADQTPIFQVLFLLQNAPQSALDLPDLQLEGVNPGTPSAKFDLALFLGETADRITGTWNYRTDLFDRTTIERLSTHYGHLLTEIAKNPDRPIKTMDLRSDMRKTERRSSKLGKLRGARQRSATRSPSDLVTMSPPPGGGNLPLVIEPRDRDLDLVGWARSQQASIDEKLRIHGALLFRGFPVETIDDFESFASTTCSSLYGEYGDLPSEEEGDKIYRSTPYPSDKTILFHNESSHMDRWPLKQYFYCVQPARERGETPIADCRQVYRCLPKDQRRRFEEKGLLYLRRFAEGLDVSWQEFFHTDDRDEVERLCRARGTKVRWHGDELELRQRAPAVAKHPVTGETVFFNQIFLHHPAALDPEVRESMESVFEEDRFPRTVRFGDGTRIEDEVVESLMELYWELAVAFSWQESDLLMIDNMLTAHARNPYEGDRKITVALGDLTGTS